MSGIFDWFKKKEVVTNPTKQTRRYPAVVDWTEDQVVNYELTYGLYHNSFPGMKLAGGLAYAPIAIPVMFMGLPCVTTVEEDEETNERLKEISEKFAVQEEQIHTEDHRDGTIWIWPHFSTELMEVIWEPIRDDVVTDIIRDLNTRKIIKIITDEQIKISTDYNTVVEARRIRIFTKKKIVVKWVMGANLLPESIKDKTMRNPTGMLPIPFANNRDSGEVRGHSDYERGISTFKDYHDVSLAWSSDSAKFRTKMVQQIGASETVDKWIENMGYTSTDQIDVANMDIIFNKGAEESTEFIFPEGMWESYSKRLKNLFQVLVESFGIPEIVWGLKTEGNLASVAENMSILIKYVRGKQTQIEDPYKQLYSATLKLLNIVEMRAEVAPDLIITWDDLDAVSAEVRSIIFRNFADGLSKMFSTASITFEQAFGIWKSMYPKQTEDDFKKFVAGLGDMGSHAQWTTASMADGAEITGGTGEDGNLQK